MRVERQSEWKTMPLEDWMAAIIDYRGKTPRKTTSGIPLVTAKIVKNGRIEAPEEFIAEADYDDWMRRGIPEPGDVVLTTEAPLGEVAQLDDTKIALAQRIITLRGKPDLLDNTYLRFALQSAPIQEQLFGRSSGSTVSGIKQSELRKLTLRFPPVDEQRRVANVLVTLDDKIDLNRRINQTLETMAQAIFKSWFVDFGPVKAKIAAIEQGEDPLHAAMRAISGKSDAELDQMPREHHDQLAATAALFSDAMEDSELGNIPKGWEVSTIGEMVEIAGGATPDTKNESYWNPPEHFWTSPKDLSGAQSPVLLATERKISTVGLSRIGSGLLPEGTLLMSSRAPIGYLAITQIPVAINQGYIAMLPGGKLPPLYLLMWCQKNMEEIKGQANGSTFMEISKKAFRPMPVIYPGSILMGRFVEAVTPLFEQLVERVKESSQLAELRDALLPRLLSGELTVPSDFNNDEESQ
ncbi:restriction endonuclease subunit S [Pseudomonas sp. CCNWLW56]|uniref:restriction endonuclease subunit S n=1 Tax=unclassified Pseudomonas TaxID=196821 RepID=UPI0030770710